MSKESILDHVQSQMAGFGGGRSQAVTHAVMYHLWRRLPFHERERMLDVLPQDVLELLEDPDNPNEPAMTADQWDREGSIEYDSYDEFCAAVRQETGLKGDGEDESAIYTVFQALKAELPDDEALRIGEMLPNGLNQLWHNAH